MICWAYVLNSGRSASPKQIALPAMTCISGPPWMPGNTRRSRSLAYSSLHSAQAGPRAAERLVRGGGDEIGDRHRIVVQPGRDQPGVVGHVDQQLRADFAGDLGELAVRNLARIGAGPGDDQLRLVLAGQPGDLVEVDAVRVARHAVADEVVELARDVQLHAVRQVAAVGQVEPQHGVARLERRQIDRHVGLRCRECGCTLACSAPKSCLARSRARFSTTSTYSQPP